MVKLKESRMYDALPKTGRRYDSSLDAVNLVCTLIEMKSRVEREANKRHKILPIPERIHRVAVNVAHVFQRYERKKFFHFESEEGHIKEFGEWLIKTYAEVCGTEARPWEHQGVPFNPELHLRKRKRIFTG